MFLFNLHFLGISYGCGSFPVQSLDSCNLGVLLVVACTLGTAVVACTLHIRQIDGTKMDFNVLSPGPIGMRS
jgi:hypothetical protein